jgi:hypothetical protein
MRSCWERPLSAVHTASVVFKTWRDRLWLGIAIAISVSVALFIGPAYITPLPAWVKVLIVIAGGATIASLALYARRQTRRS